MSLAGDWQSTVLWRRVVQAEASDPTGVRPAVEAWMPKVVTVLARAETAAADLTLRDGAPGYRGADWVGRIIPPDVLEKLTAFEAALLLMSAYLHDIGMTPDRGHVKAIWHHLLLGKGEVLPAEEVERLQNWLDQRGDNLEAPL